MPDDSRPTKPDTTVFARCVRGVFAAVILLFGFAALFSGQTYQLLVFSLVFAVMFTIPSRLWSIICGQVVFHFTIHVLKPENRKYSQGDGLADFVILAFGFLIGQSRIVKSSPNRVLG